MYSEAAISLICLTYTMYSEATVSMTCLTYTMYSEATIFMTCLTYTMYSEAMKLNFELSFHHCSLYTLSPCVCVHVCALQMEVIKEGYLLQQGRTFQVSLLHDVCTCVCVLSAPSSTSA